MFCQLLCCNTSLISSSTYRCWELGSLPPSASVLFYLIAPAPPHLPCSSGDVRFWQPNLSPSLSAGDASSSSCSSWKEVKTFCLISESPWGVLRWFSNIHHSLIESTKSSGCQEFVLGSENSFVKGRRESREMSETTSERCTKSEDTAFPAFMTSNIISAP